MQPIQSLWIGAALGPIQQLSVQSFLDHGHDFVLYCYDKVSGVPVGARLMDAGNILPYDSALKPAGKDQFGASSRAVFADKFRTFLLYQRGGWWVDPHVVWLRPFPRSRPISWREVWKRRKEIARNIKCPKFRAGHAVLAYCRQRGLEPLRRTLLIPPAS